MQQDSLLKNKQLTVKSYDVQMTGSGVWGLGNSGVMAGWSRREGKSPYCVESGRQ
jgi:hypothetical protein